MCRYHSLAHGADIQRGPIKIKHRLWLHYVINYPACTWLWTCNIPQMWPLSALSPASSAPTHMLYRDLLESPTEIHQIVTPLEATLRRWLMENQHWSNSVCVVSERFWASSYSSLQIHIQFTIDLHPRQVVKQHCTQSSGSCGTRKAGRA